MSCRRFLFLGLPLAFALVQPAGAKQRGFEKVDADGDSYIDPAEFAGNAKGKAWMTAMIDFVKRDADNDGLLSAGEYAPAKTNGGDLHDTPEVQEAVPLKWTTGINLTWEDGVVSAKERKSFNALLKKATPAQRQALKGYWDALQAAVLEAGPQGAIEAIAGVWAQSDPQAAVEWVESVLENDDAREELLQGIVSGWAQSDPGAAAAWLAGLEIGPPREIPPHREF